ncbi:MAG: ferritin family protein [Candidatus Omnitrophota bacterium]|nr:ferritin family protein [Candidatus Omnitrophota bacterium]
MANVFNAAEVIDMGIEKEKKRRDFYALASRKFKDRKMKELFTRLTEWEEAHIKKFTDIRNSVEEYEIAESYQGEFESYIKSLVDDKLYKQVSPGQFGKSVKTPLQAIQYGIGFEKDAILFFGELIGYMPPIHVEKIKELIDEERKHLIYLSELKRKY